VTLNHAEEQQVEALKTWWKNYGPSVVVGIVLGVAVLGGYKYWVYQKAVTGEEASLLYAQTLLDFRANKEPLVRTNAGRLIDEYASTPYSDMAALLLAKLDYQAGNKAEARKHLQWVVEHAEDDGLQHTARLRLGRLMLELKDYDAALKLLIIDEVPGFESEYHELRGDIYTAKGMTAQAREAYQLALQKLLPGSGIKNILEMKLANLGTEAS